MHTSRSASGIAGGLERRVDRLALLRRELQLGLPVPDALDVHARLLAVEDRGDDHARALGVEQRVGARLLPRHLAVGVVTDERRVGEAGFESTFGPAPPLGWPLE